MDTLNILYLKKRLKYLYCYFLGANALFLLVSLIKAFHFSVPFWVTSYLNDFVAVPIVATLCLLIIWKIKKDTEIRIHPIALLLIVVIYSVYFEVFLPRYTERYIADWGDVICYILGGVTFLTLQGIETEDGN